MTLLLVVAVLVLFLWSSSHASRLDRLSRALELSEHTVGRLTQRIWWLEQGGGASHSLAPPASPFRISGLVAEPVMAPRAAREAPAPAPPAEPAPGVVAEPAEAAASPAPAVLAAPAPIDWEKWLGVRGAAATGAVILVVALLYFLRYSIEAGLLTPTLRLWLGCAASMLCVACGHGWVRARHVTLASWLTGAGIAGLYATLWAAVHVVGALGAGVAFVASIGVTALGVALALRLGSLPIALLGILGGLAAPLALGLYAAQPLAVVAYVLLLDLAASALAIARRWWPLATLATLATLGYGLMLATSAATGALPILALVVALSSLCLGLALRAEQHGLSVIAVIGAVALSLAWLGAHDASGPASHVAFAFAAYAPFAAAAALRPTRESALGVGASAASGALLLVIGSIRCDAPALWVPSLLALAAGVVFAARAVDLPGLARAAVTGCALGLGLVSLGALAQGAGLGSSAAAWLGAACALVAALYAGRGRWIGSELGASLRAGAASGAAVMLGVVAVAAHRIGLAPAAAALGVFAATSWLAAGPSLLHYPIAALLSAAGLAAAQLGADAPEPRAFLGLLALFGGAFALAPVAGRRASASTPPCQVVALTAFGLAALASASSAAHGAVVAVVLCAAALLLVVLLERTAARASAGRALGSFALLMGLCAAAAGLDGGDRLVAIGALGSFAVAFDRRWSHAALAAGGAGLLALAAALSLDPRLLGGHPRGELPLLNSVTLTYVAPAALSWAAHVVTRRAAIRRLAGGLALASGFVLANVCVLDLFSVGATLSLSGASQARDLAMSLVWALYAVALLALGLRRDVGALRWTSLALCLLTAGKVFLFDLNNLRDLHRVAALLGLAASLLAISVSYQRFVIRRPAAAQ